MGKFENGKYVCIIKWCFRWTKCGWSRKKGKITQIVKEWERERTSKNWEETVEYAEESMAQVRVASRKRIISEGSWTNNCYDMKWTIEVHPNERAKEQEGKRKIAKLLYIFTYYFRLCTLEIVKMERATVVHMLFIFYFSGYVPSWCERTHIHIHIPAYVFPTQHLHIWSHFAFAFMKNNLI